MRSLCLDVVELKFALFIGYHLYMLCGLDVSFLFPFRHNFIFNWPSTYHSILLGIGKKYPTQ